jgi:Rrf2 family transcriptional regulator, cysteine metabolism repressor
VKFSIKIEYGLRAMIELALREGQGPIWAREIAARQDIPERFLEQQITALKKAGLVNSQRGAGGGCALAKSPGEVTVLEIVEALDGPVMNMDCISAKTHNCRHFSQCVVQELWLEAQLKFREYLSSVTVADLAGRQRLKAEEGMIYHI